MIAHINSRTGLGMSLSHPGGLGEEVGLHLFLQQISLKKKIMGFTSDSVVKNPPANAGDTSSIPGPRRSHMPWSNRALEPQLLSLCSRAWDPHLLKLGSLGGCALKQEKPQPWEAQALQLESSPCSLEWEKASMQLRRPSTAKINKYIHYFKKSFS